jgi:hypothetical protein
VKPLQEAAPVTDILPLAVLVEPLTSQHVNAATVTDPTFTLYDDDVDITAKFKAEGLVTVNELPCAIFI